MSVVYFCMRDDQEVLFTNNRNGFPDESWQNIPYLRCSKQKGLFIESCLGLNISTVLSLGTTLLSSRAHRTVARYFVRFLEGFYKSRLKPRKYTVKRSISPPPPPSSPRQKETSVYCIMRRFCLVPRLKRCIQQF